MSLNGNYFFFNNELEISALKRFCDLLHNIADRNIANPLHVEIIHYHMFPVKCDLHDVPLHIGGLRYFTLSDIEAYEELRCDECLQCVISHRDFAILGFCL